MTKHDRSLLPCSTCPWRMDIDATMISRYNHQKALDLINTVGKGDDFRPIMACHNSTDSHMRACKGYLAQEGWSNLNVRLLLCTKQIANPSQVKEACEAHRVALESDCPTVIAKLSASFINRKPRGTKC
jgi:hypothetical protein